EEGPPLLVVGTDLFPAFHHLDPLAGPRSGDGGERRAARVVDVGPQLETHRRVDVHPLEPAVGKRRSGRPDGFADGEVDVVGRDAELSGADPELGPPRIDVHARGAARPGEYPRGNRAVELRTTDPAQ